MNFFLNHYLKPTLPATSVGLPQFYFLPRTSMSPNPHFPLLRFPFSVISSIPINRIGAREFKICNTL